MRITQARQILKAFADDTRLRIVNLLRKGELSVTELCAILNKNQSNLSKHLAQLRLTEIVCDRREGFNVYYYLVEPKERAHRELLNTVTFGLAGMETFRKDLMRLKEFKKRKRNYRPALNRPRGEGGVKWQYCARKQPQRPE